MRQALIQLIKTKVIVPQTGSSRPMFASFVSRFLSERSVGLILFAALATSIVVLIDTWDVWVGYSNGHFDRGPDWETAFLYWPDRFRFPGPYVRQQDLVFTILAYSLETAAALVSFYWIGKYWQFLRCLAEIIRGKNGNYKFNPLIHEPKRRFGLYPLAPLFNGFLVLTVVFQIYALFHRLQQHEHYRRNESGIQYLMKLFQEDAHGKENEAKDPDQKEEAKFSLTGMLNLAKQDYSLDTLCHPSTMLPLILTTIPFAVISFLPLGAIRLSVERFRNREYEGNSRALDDAVNSGKEDEAKVYREKQAALEKANIWPNGDLTGWGFLCLIAVLSIGAWLPPLLIYLITCGGLVWLWKLFQKLRFGNSKGT
jgi:hypothetical protein